MSLLNYLSIVDSQVPLYDSTGCPYSIMRTWSPGDSGWWRNRPSGKIPSEGFEMEFSPYDYEILLICFDQSLGVSFLFQEIFLSLLEYIHGHILLELITFLSKYTFDSSPSKFSVLDWIHWSFLILCDICWFNFPRLNFLLAHFLYP
jgi:hypothetical protein